MTIAVCSENILSLIEKNIRKSCKSTIFFWKRDERLHSFWKSASAGAGAITKNQGAVRKCVRINYWSAGVRAPHSKISRNPTSDCDGVVYTWWVAPVFIALYCKIFCLLLSTAQFSLGYIFSHQSNTEQNEWSHFVVSSTTTFLTRCCRFLHPNYLFQLVFQMYLRNLVQQVKKHSFS